MTEKKSPLRDTRWLAERLGLSVSTIERLRSTQPGELPPCVKLGAVYRYSEAMTEEWLQRRSERPLTASEEGKVQA
jgi:predicted DNA-binding transcriptional regulator AlpA